MPHGCWIDLFGAPDPSGERRRIFGPTTLDAFVWRRYAEGERIAIATGPAARVWVTFHDGSEEVLLPRATSSILVANSIARLTIERPSSSDAVAEDGQGRPIVQRDVRNPPPRRRSRRTVESVGEPNA